VLIAARSLSPVLAAFVLRKTVVSCFGRAQQSTGVRGEIGQGLDTGAERLYAQRVFEVEGST
jgi:hypothetical protein